MNRTANLAIAALALLAACSGKESTHVDLFQASPATIQAGESTTLLFATSNAKSMTIDNGVGDVTGKSSIVVTPAMTTAYTLTAVSKDNKADTSSVTVTVVPARASAFLVELPATAIAGQAVTVTVTALRADDTALDAFVGSATLSTDDVQATLPASVVFAAGAHGKATAQVTFKTAGAHQIGAGNAANSAARGGASVTVKNAAASKLTLSGLPANVRAGDTVSVRVAALDAFGNFAVDYRGTVALSTNDASATLPAAAALGAADAGVRSFGISFATSGAATLAASDGALSASATATVRNAPASRIAVGLTADSVTAGDNLSIAVMMLDRFDNGAVDYMGTVHLLSSDAAAPTFADVAFGATDQGSKSISVTLVTEGTQVILAQDAASPALTGANSVRVKHGVAIKYALSALPGAAAAGDPLPLTITALDAHNNVVTDYAGTAHVSSADTTDRLPADGSFSGGVRTVSLAFVKAASHFVSVNEVGGSITATSTTTAVGPAAASVLQITGPGSATSGATATWQVSAFDPYGNLATGYRGTVHISSDDGAALLPADFAFGSATSGTKQFSATMATAGAHTLSVADTASSSIRGGLIVQVSPGAAASYQLSSLPATTTAGSPIAVTVTARDAHGNVATGETSSAHFSTGEATDVLPADPAFSAGVLSVSVSLLKAGTRALTVSQVGGSLQAVSANVQVNPAAAASLALGGAGASTAGDAVSFTATAHDAYGNQATGYAAIVHVTSSDGQAVTPADFAAAVGAANFQVTFKTTGLQTVQIGDGSISTSSSVTVSAAAAVSLAVSDVPASANAGDSLPANVTAKDLYGNVAPTYAGTVSFTTDGDGKAALPASYAFTPGDGGRHTFSFALGTTGTWKLGVSDGHFSATSAGTLVSPGVVDRFVIASLPLSAHAGDALSAIITAKDRFGNTTTSYAGTLHSVLTDTAAPVVSDKQASAGSATISFTLVTVGKQSIIVSDAAFSSLSSSSELEVTPAAATRYQLATLPAMAVAGQPLTLAALALDDFGNVDTSYAALAHVAGSTGDELSPDSAFSAGRLSVGVSFTKIGSHKVTLSEVNGTISKDSSFVSVTSDDAVALSVAPNAATAVAGAGADFTVTARDRFDNQVATYAGQVDFTSNDAQFVSPGPHTFNSGDAGSHAFTATFKTAGVARVDVRDTSATSISGGAAWTVVPGAAVSCAVDQTPTAAAPVTQITFRVTISDAFANKATNYQGTIGVASSDGGAQFASSSVTYDPSVDRGSHIFTVSFGANGLKQLTATDSANSTLTCSQQVMVEPLVHYVVALPADANVGVPTSITITVQDATNQIITNYAQTVVLTSSDNGVTPPGPVAFDGSQNGTTTVQVTFASLGVQTVVATQQNNSVITGSGATNVHGLVYSDPPAGLGVVRLIANRGVTTPGLVQLDLVAAQGVPIGYGVGMNLPASTSRVLPDDTMLVTGNVFDPGDGTRETRAVAASLTMLGPTANVLYTGLSSKNAGVRPVVRDVKIAAGGLFYSIRLKLNPAAQPGVVFDGAIAMANFRAAVRDRLGNDTVAQSDFAVGRLEVR